MTSVTTKKTAKTFLKGQEMVAKYYVFVIKKKELFYVFRDFFSSIVLKMKGGNQSAQIYSSDLFV